ncbi:hypothetical protein IC744_16265 [Microbacterium hominis]|uniref:hypothetical protein n=1 Tax=Microbacterium hominis TaxID=162426 RepID=UPI00168BEC64|nr:hypothetical protein [Microbacterium hominis]QOC24816.1 hypothetical protein IC745_10515 [Microbacterium hominis]QOC28869.1 hypothetical protein IC744_16265 [Microbacterium hominis]
MNAAADRLDDSFPHGTVDGYKGGCRGNACPAGDEYGLSCKRANQLNAGDYRYQKLVKRGLTPGDIALELGLVPENPTKGGAVADAFGITEPRVWTVPLRPLTPKTSRGFAVIDFARDTLHVTLYPWQEWLLIHLLAEERGRLAAQLTSTSLLVLSQQDEIERLRRVIEAAATTRQPVMRDILRVGRAR